MGGNHRRNTLGRRLRPLRRAAAPPRAQGAKDKANANANANASEETRRRVVRRGRRFFTLSPFFFAVRRFLWGAG